MEIEFIFVYGSLRKKAAVSMNAMLTHHCEYFCDGTMQGKLYEVNGYPGAIESNDPKDKVYGELYRIVGSENLLPLLDEYEECTDKYRQPHEYMRKKLTISLACAGGVTAWVYVFNHDVSELVQIESGDYLRF